MPKRAAGEKICTIWCYFHKIYCSESDFEFDFDMIFMKYTFDFFKTPPNFLEYYILAGLTEYIFR